MSEWYDAKDEDIDVDLEQKQVDIYVTSNDCGAIYVSLTFDQVKEIYDAKIDSSYERGRMMEWIKVEDRLPEDRVLVLCWQESMGACIREHIYEDGYVSWYDEHNNYDDSDLKITHWMPLPPPPTGE